MFNHHRKQQQIIRIMKSLVVFVNAKIYLSYSTRRPFECFGLFESKRAFGECLVSYIVYLVNSHKILKTKLAWFIAINK